MSRLFYCTAIDDEDPDGVVTYYAFYSENQAAADDAANGEEAAGQDVAGDDANATGDDADESSIAPQTGDAPTLPLSLALAVSRASLLPLLRCFAAVAATS